MTSSDRQLLERAAKAAGMELVWEVVPDGGPDCEAGEYPFSSGVSWNPLKSDADALRLAVKLEIDVCFFPGFREIRAEAASVQESGHAIEDYTADMAANVRRAIVRAAASLGEHK